MDFILKSYEVSASHPGCITLLLNVHNLQAIVETYFLVKQKISDVCIKLIAMEVFCFWTAFNAYVSRFTMQ